MYVQTAWLLFALFLYILCAVLMVLEIFIPSFGLLTVLAVGAFAWAVTIFFQIGTTAGWIGLVIALILIPAFWILTYKVFPKTAIGRAMELKTISRVRGDAIPDMERLSTLQGKSGKTLSTLRPVGICRIDGLRIACSAEAGMIHRNTEIEVVKVEGQRITVRIRK